MKVIPFNNRILIEEVSEKEETKFNGAFVPDFVKERKNVDKFLRGKIVAISPNSNHEWMLGKQCIVDTGLLDEVVINKKKFIFVAANFIVCILDDSKDAD